MLYNKFTKEEVISMENNIYKTNIPTIFDSLTSKNQYEEVGISFEGEIKIDDYISVITNKNIKSKNPKEAKNTYLKVMEMRELTEEEMQEIGPAKKVLKAAFEVLCSGSKLCVFYAVFLATTLGLDIYNGNFIQILIKTACLIWVLKPVKFLKEVRKILKSPERIEELREYLHGKGVSGYINSVDNDEDIKMYVKVRKDNQIISKVKYVYDTGIIYTDTPKVFYKLLDEVDPEARGVSIATKVLVNDSNTNIKPDSDRKEIFHVPFENKKSAVRLYKNVLRYIDITEVERLKLEHKIMEKIKQHDFKDMNIVYF